MAAAMVIMVATVNQDTVAIDSSSLTAMAFKDSTEVISRVFATSIDKGGGATSTLAKIEGCGALQRYIQRLQSHRFLRRYCQKIEVAGSNMTDKSVSSFGGVGDHGVI